MAVISTTPASPSTVSDVPRVKVGVFNTAQAAGTYDLLTATGDVYVEVLSAYAKTAGGGFTTAAVATNHTTPKSIVAAAVAAAVTLDLAMTLVTTAFVLPSGKKIQGTIVGTGNAGEIDVVVRYSPLTAGATLS